MKRNITLVLKGMGALGIMLYGGFLVFYNPQEDGLDAVGRVKIMVCVLFAAGALVFSARLD